MSEYEHDQTLPTGDDSSSGALWETPVSKDYLPRSLDAEFPGKLIVVEGPDGSGRSTQIALLGEWLEWQGYAIQSIGLKRSKLLAKDLDDLTRSNELQLMTQVLLYATDFYDQIENVAVPALRAGFIVLADRYTLTLQCRAQVRDVPNNYLQNLYRFAPEADLKLCLNVNADESFQRLFARKSVLNHWEVGGDLNLAGNLYDSFTDYQAQLRNYIQETASRDRYHNVDGSRAVSQVNEDLRAKVGALLGIEDLHYTPSDKLRSLWELR